MLQVAANGPERSDDITLFLPQLWMAASRACCLSARGPPPYPGVRLLLTLLMASRIMGRKFLSCGGTLGSIPPSSSSVET